METSKGFISGGGQCFPPIVTTYRLDIKEKMLSDMEHRRDSKLEFPEIQVVPTKVEGGNPLAASRPMGGFGRRPVMVGDAKKKFSKMAMKVITQIVTEEEKQPETNETKEKPPEPPKEKHSEPRKSHGLLPERRQSKAPRGSLSPRVGGVSPSPSQSKHGSQSDLLSVSHSGSLGKVNNQFASLVRLAKFRRMTNAFGKGSSTSSRRTSVIDIEEESDLPAVPRFCATLSPEAQYSMMKGYEDVLLDRIRSVRSEYNNLLYRVKTPHQTVLALHIAELPGVVEASEARSQLTVSRPPSSDIFPRTYNSLPREKNPLSFSFPQNKKGGTRNLGPSESQVKRITVPKEKQRKLSTKFQRAMDILDALKTEEGIPVTSTFRSKKVANPIAYYNSWSQAWAREFQFEYAACPAIKH